MAANALLPLEVPMRCERCGAYTSRADSHCRKCGAALPSLPERNLRLPVKRAPSPPTLWRQAAPVLARGVALVALGVAAEIALTALAKGALRLPARRPAKSKLPAQRDGEMPEGTYAVSETVVMRRVTLRR
jgi:ribosomal protein L40E